MISDISPVNGWLTGEQILKLALSEVLKLRIYIENKTNVEFRSYLLNIILIQAGKRGISLLRREVEKLTDLVFIEENVERREYILVIPDEWNEKIDQLLRNHYCSKCGVLLEIEHDDCECRNRILKEVMES